ncbi:hypothetical protein ABZ357_33150 [Streptomyces sp. NPDC005917]|uniref:hypothetical protein n=1 Tax=unclassified Streptomyces TaxID=2593676 RepID=UPI0033E99C54
MLSLDVQVPACSKWTRSSWCIVWAGAPPLRHPFLLRLRQRVRAGGLERGGRVAAIARNTDSLADLPAAHGEAILPLALNVTDKAALFAAVQWMHEPCPT